MQATPTMLLKTQQEEMSLEATPTMLLKISNLTSISHDVMAKKGA